MNTDLSNLRNDYSRGILDEENVAADPFVQFESWFKDALGAGIKDPNAMVLATSTGDNRPSARVVLLKGLAATGFTFFTNYQSRKGIQLEENPNAALLFFWDVLERQVRIEGTISRVSSAESEEYFNSRPLLSRMSAIASPQSKAVSRHELEAEVKRLQALPQDNIQCPPHWGGFVLQPTYFEFWQGRTNRLHDRIVYERVQQPGAIEIENGRYYA